MKTNGESNRSASVGGENGPSMNDLTAVFERVQAGDHSAMDRLFTLSYDELRLLAARKMNHETVGQAFQAADLVHEAWLRLGGDAQPPWRNRAHFFAAAGEAMRRVLVDGARRRRSIRHGGTARHVNIDDPSLQIAAPIPDQNERLLVRDALDRLAGLDGRKAKLVKLRYFRGLTIRQAAAALNISEPTAKRDWTYARAWLSQEIQRLKREVAGV